MAAEQPRWYAVHTKASREELARRGLKERGYEVFYPHQLGTTTHARRRLIGVKRPYFPRYVFVDIQPGQSFADVNWTPGVSAIVYLSEEPLQIPTEVIAELRARGDRSGCIPIDKGMSPHSPYRPGQEVKIVGGPFMSFLAVVEDVDKNGKLYVWLSVFGRRTGTEIAPEWVRP